jgi:hypothetical protein
MIDCGHCVMRESRCRDCTIAVTETRNVTGHLGQAELRALRVLADAGLVPPLARVLTSSAARSWAHDVESVVMLAGGRRSRR